MPPGGPGRPGGPPPPPRGPRIRLPFEQRPTDPTTWVYEHQVGLLSMVAALLIIGIAFVSAQIVIMPAQHAHTIYIDLQDLPQPEQKELTPEERKALEESLRDARNQISNEDAQRESDRQTARNNPISPDMAQRAQEVQDRVRASREAYEQGLRDEQALIDASKNRPEQDTKPQEQTKVKGNVIISFSLDGRTFVYMHVPAYQCEGGGEVVANITVNRNGKVTAANIRSSSTSDDCITSRALEAARLSRFNVDASAPDRQQGTITYLFVPQ